MKERERYRKGEKERRVNRPLMRMCGGEGGRD